MSTALDPEDPKPEFSLDYEGNQERRHRWIERFFRGLPQERLLLSSDDTLWYCPRWGNPRPVETLDEFQGISPELYHYYKEIKGDRVFSDLPRNEARLIFHSREAKTVLPRFRFLLTEPAVALDPSGQPYLIDRGFDSNTGIFYCPSAEAHLLEPRPGVEHLTRCFSGLRFEEPTYRANLMAWLLGALVLDPSIEAPLVVISGNQANIGKSKTMEAAGILLTGAVQTPISYKGDEFGKQLSARFSMGQRFIVLDNVTTRGGEAYSNQLLAQFLTQGWSKSVRILGYSREVTQKGVLFAITANSCRLDNDLATRALSVKLWSSEAPYPIVPYILEYVEKYRREIYGELLNLALTPANEGTSDTFTAFRYQKWLEFVRPRIEPHFGPLAILQSSDLNEAVQSFYTWIADGSNGEFTTADLIAQFDLTTSLSGLKNHFAGIPTKKGRANAISRFLNSQLNSPIILDRVEYTLSLKADRTTHRSAVYVCKMRSLLPEDQEPASCDK